MQKETYRWQTASGYVNNCYLRRNDNVAIIYGIVAKCRVMSRYNCKERLRGQSDPAYGGT